MTPVPRRVVLATGNRGKAREIAAMLGSEWQVVLQGELGLEVVEESGVTFEENALLKARHAAAASGLAALADDSGLEVEALGGAPGVHSARYAGADATDGENVAKLLAALSSVPDGRRAARFRCVLVLVHGPGDPRPLVATGEWQGRITRSPRGDTGFGYDPVFEDPATGLTAAELAPEAKNARSHRGQALRALHRLIAGLDKSA
jgi:XTP/dITP diphosphohydrolase